MCSRLLQCMRGTGPRTTGAGARFFCSAGACLLRSLPHLGHPDNPGHPASDVIDIKVLTDLFSLLHLRSIDIKVLSDLELSVGGCRSARACPSRAFSCLNQDCQDCQDVQDGIRLGTRCKGLEDLNVYRNQQQQGVKVRRTLIGTAAGVRARDRPSRYGGRGAFSFVVQGTVPRDLSLILCILRILAILLQTRETLRSSRTFSACCADVL